MNLADQLSQAAKRSTGVSFYAAGEVVHHPWSELLERGLALLDHLALPMGAPLLIAGRTSPTTVGTILACWAQGRGVSLQPVPRGRARATGIVELRRRAAQVGADVLLVDAAIAAEVAAGFPAPASHNPLTCGSLAVVRSNRRGGVPLPADVRVLQHTSGTTGPADVVLVGEADLLANTALIRDGAALDADSDVLVSWLPLFHDMGLIGLLATAAIWGAPLRLCDPGEFAHAPRTWFDMLADGGTFSAAPSFAYAIGARVLAGDPGRIDLSAWRVALNGGELVDVDAVRAFGEAGARWSLCQDAAFPAYGLAEATLAVCFPEPGTGLRLGRPSPAEETVPDHTSTRYFASVGRPLPGFEVDVVAPDGTLVVDGTVGEIVVRGGTLLHRRLTADGSLEAFATDGTLRTGDLGFMIGGELHPTGRSKDVIILNGVNVIPEWIEQAASSVDGVRSGRAVAIGVQAHGTETLVVGVEADCPSPTLVRSVRSAVLERCNAIVADVVVVEPRTLPRTSSGKWRRGAFRDAYLASRRDSERR